MFKTIINAFKIKEIRSRLLFTLACLVVVRIGSNITVPAIDSAMLKDWADNQLTQGLLATLTGGALSTLSIFALSISPYINAEIIMQLLTIAIPKLEEMQKDGEDGRQKIQKISRYLTVVLALIESTAMAISFGYSSTCIYSRYSISYVAWRQDHREGRWKRYICYPFDQHRIPSPSGHQYPGYQVRPWSGQ